MMKSRTEQTVSELSVFQNFQAKRLGLGRFGTAVFMVKYNDGIAVDDVAVKRMEKDKVQIDSSFYRRANGQPNVIKYYCTHETHPKFT